MVASSSDWGPSSFEDNGADDIDHLLWSELADSDDEDAHGRPSKGKAGQILFDLLIKLCLTGILDAKLVCTIAYWCFFAGAVGPVCDLALNPSTDTGNFNQHFEKIVGLKRGQSRLLHLNVPVYDKSNMCRTSERLPIMSPHELVHEEVVKNPALQELHNELVASEYYPPVYMEHPVSVSLEHTNLPLYVYTDGVPITKRDGVLGIWVGNMVSKKRHLCAAVRKSKFCRCGCKGWCTLWPILNAIRWSALCLAVGLFPELRPDNQDWQPEDDLRASLAGLVLSCTACICMIKADWLEFATTFGFFACNSLIAPCFKCLCCQADLFKDEDLTAVSEPAAWPPLTHAAYENACDRGEISVVIDVAAKACLTLLLSWNSNRGGLVLTTAVRQLGLQAWDRLEPNSVIQDVGEFAELDTTTSKTVVFWRPANETRCKHRNPLFDAVIGITVLLLMPDTLHALNLGVMQVFCRELLWNLILTNSWQCGYTTLPELVDKSLSLCKSQLLHWYGDRRNKHRELYTEVQDISSKMIGTQDKRKLKLKGAETKGFLFFIDWLIGTARGARLNRRDVWKLASSSLVTVSTLLAFAESYVVPPATQQDTHT